MSPTASADAVRAEVQAVGAESGLIVMNTGGRIALRFTGDGLYRAEASSGGTRIIARAIRGVGR